MNFDLGLGVKYPLSKTFSLYLQSGCIGGIASTRTNSNNVFEEVKDDFMKLVFGIEVSFIKQPDSDKDGVIDNLDECPGTPKGANVDKFGCPTDSGGDGVYDGIDKCPDIPTGTKVDENGCPDMKVKLDLLNSKLDPIYCDTNEHTITANQMVKVTNLVQVLKENPDFMVNIFGYCDPRGDADFNKALSQRRIDSVVAQLKQRGLMSSVLQPLYMAKRKLHSGN